MTTLTTMIPHSRPFLGQEEIHAVTELLRSGQLAQGPVVERFERSLAAFVGVQGGVAVSSGTAALELAMRALGVSPGDEVIMPSYVCAAPWLAATRVGAHPKLVDIQIESYSIDPEEVRKVLSTRTKAIVVPHLFGLPAGLTALEGLGIPIIEDCAQTLGAIERGRQVGTVGIMSVCSFYATKLLCAGEGGMVLSDDAALLDRVRSLRQYDEEPSLNIAASNHKMTDLQAAIGLSQLNRLPSFLERRSWIASEYDAALSGKHVIPPSTPSDRSHVYYRYVVRFPHMTESPERSNQMIGRLERHGIQCRRPIFRPLHRYLDLKGYPVSRQADDQALSIPIYPALTDDEVARTVRILSAELT